jgi:membrane-associated phospholipid phosphatase
MDALRQLVLFAGAYYLYRLVRGAVDGQVTIAFQNARDIVDAERALGLFFEPALQDWALSNQWVVDAANWCYINSHFLVTTTFLIWLYLARNETYYYVRNMFMVAMGLALLLYVAYPTAPPRFMPEWGFADTVTDAVGYANANNANLLYNPYAAVPSMHVAFALMVGIPAFKIVRHTALKAAWAAYPVLVTFVVLVTANHWWIDAALGVAVAAVAAVAASAAFGRARPEAWAWRAPALGAKAAA